MQVSACGGCRVSAHRLLMLTLTAQQEHRQCSTAPVDGGGDMLVKANFDHAPLAVRVNGRLAASDFQHDLALRLQLERAIADSRQQYRITRSIAPFSMGVLRAFSGFADALCKQRRRACGI